MKSEDFEGSEVLEKLAAIGKVDAFFEAIDSDNIKKVVFLLRQANVEANIIDDVLRQISDVND